LKMHVLSQIWSNIRNDLFPELEKVLPPLSEKQRKLVAILELVNIEKYAGELNLTYFGRPKKDRIALARAFVAKMVYNLPTTRLLIEQLLSNDTLRRLCGWEYRRDIPSESTFSRAFEEFAVSNLPAKVHAELIKTQLEDRLVGHVSRDSTAIKAKEKLAPKEKKEPEKLKKRGRPKKGEERPLVELKRIERQLNQTLEQMLEELPTACDRGTKKDSKGYKHSWNGYKLHLDVDDNGIPISAILTSASLHDSQVAIPLAMMTSKRVVNFYDLMDSAYDAELIKEHSRGLGHVPIVDHNPRGGEKIKMDPAKSIRYNTRTSVERANGRLKEEFGACMVRVKGAAKVFAHLMFGVLALAADQLLKLVQ